MSTEPLVGHPSAPECGLEIQHGSGPAAIPALAAAAELFKPTKNLSTFSPDFTELATDVLVHKAMLWLTLKDSRLAGVTVTTLIAMPYGMVLQFRYGRSTVPGVAEATLDFIISETKANGPLDFIELEGRAGFSRKLFPRFGQVKPLSSIYRIPVE